MQNFDYTFFLIPRVRWENDTRMDIEYKCYMEWRWVELAGDRAQC